MSQNKLLVALFSSVLALFSLNSFAGEQDWPEITEDGLHRVHDAEMAGVWAEPGADLAPYTRVILMEPTVAFKKNWERDLRSQSASKVMSIDTNKIKKELAQEFQVVFTDKLNSNGYEVVEEAGDDVLIVRPAIVDLDITAPETRGTGNTNSKVRSHGAMTLYVELFDSVTGDIIAKAIDRQKDNEFGTMYTWATPSSNKAAAKRILNGWADILLAALNEAKSHPAELESD